MNRVHESLQHSFLSYRIVVWYDGEQEWRETASAFQSDNLDCLVVEGNPFGTKVRILTDPDPTKQFLVYVPEAKPEDSENWLLDLLKQGHEFKADRVSLAVQEAGLHYDHRLLVDRYLDFFKSKDRVASFRERARGEDDADQLRRHMMGVYAGTPSDIDSLLRAFASRAFEEPMFDPVAETLKAGDLPEVFWDEVKRLFGYASATQGMRDFMVYLFRAANPLDPNLKLNGHATVFLQQWKDSRTRQGDFERWSIAMERDLNIPDLIESGGSLDRIGTQDVFEAFDRFVLHRGCGLFVEGGKGSRDLRTRLESRMGGFWMSSGGEERPGHGHGYLALLAACDLRDALDALELTAPNLPEAVRRYRGAWHKVDRYYRTFCFHLEAYPHLSLFSGVTDWVEKNYLNRFLLPLSDLWNDTLAQEASWVRVGGVSAQIDFFEHAVRPILDRDQKVVVIVSDALRYEAGEELADRLRRINRITVESEAMMAAIPGYTQLGMASLLPGVDVEVDPESELVAKGGRPTSGVENRSAILSEAMSGRGCAMQAEVFLSLHSQREGRPLMKANEVLYVYHNRIDKVGDDRHTEVQTPQAVERAFDELERMITKAFSINFTHVLVTADHGFLFQRDPVLEGDATPVPKAETLLKKNRRFLFGRGFKENASIIVKVAGDLGLPGEWQCAFPRALGRFPLKGSGKRFVHGGMTPQEMLVPILRVHKKRSDDQGKVRIEVLRLPAKITTGQLAVALYQAEPVAPKMTGRTLSLQLTAKNGDLLSDRVEIKCDSDSEEPRKREQTVVLTLSRKADAHNNEDVVLEISELRDDNGETVPFKSERIRLQKSYEGDFEDF